MNARYGVIRTNEQRAFFEVLWLREHRPQSSLYLTFMAGICSAFDSAGRIGLTLVKPEELCRTIHTGIRQAGVDMRADLAEDAGDDFE